MQLFSGYFKFPDYTFPFWICKALSTSDQFKTFTFSWSSYLVYDHDRQRFYVPARSIIFLWMVCCIFSDHLCDHMESLLQELEEKHLKEEHQRLILEKEIHHLHTLDDEYQKLYRWNHDTSNHLLALSLLAEHEEYEQALAYIEALKASEEENHEISESVQN